MTTRRQSNNQETILRSNWDNSGIDFKAFTVEVTDTASGPNSTVMDLRVDGISVGSLGKDGSLILPTPLPVASGGTGTDNNTDARTNLGLGSISTQDSSNVSITGGSITGITDLAIADGGTGASTAADARTNLGLGSISTQDSSNILITGGSITGITDLAIADGGTGASTAADARDNLVVVHRAGDTMTGDLTVGDGTAGFSVNIDGANSTDRSLTYLTNGSLRWEIVTNSDSESGLNEGSNFNLRRYNDAGSLIGNSINISRSTGDTTFENDIAVGDGFTMQPDATFSLGVKGLKTTSRSLQYFSGTTLRWEVLTNNSPEEDLTSPSIPTKLADPASLPTGNGWSVAFSPDGVHMAVAHFTSPFIAIYERSGNTFTKLANPATLPAGDARSAAFSPDGKHLVVAHAVSPFITIYERVGNTFTKLPNPATLPPDTGRSVSFSPDGKHLVVGHALTPHVTIYERSGNTFTKVADPAILPPNTVNGVAFSPDGNHLVAVHFDSPFLTIYKRSGNTFTKLADPATTPASTGFAVAFSPNNTHMVVGHDVAPRITIYKISGNTFTKLPDPSSIPSGDVRGVAFSSDDVHMVATHLLSPFITVYERAGDTFTKLPDPSSLPTGTGRGATFSPDAGFMPIAHDTIPFITIYDSPVGVNTNGGSDFSIKRYGDGGTVIGEPIKISRETGLMSLQGLTSVESGGFTLSDGGIAPSDANVSFGIDGVNATNRTIEYFTGDDIRWKVEVNNSPEEDPTAPAVATKLANPAVLPTGTGFGVAVSPDGTHMAVAHVTSPFVTIYERSGNTFTKLANPATLPTGSGFGVAFSPDGTHLAVAHDNFPFIIIYERSGNTFTKLANPATLPTSTGRGVAFSPDGVHLAVTHSSPSPFVTIYERSGNTFTKLANPATLPPDATRGVAFSPDGRHLAVGHFQTPFITIYERSGNTFTKVADPATLPASTGFGIDFSPDGTYMAVAHDSSPFVTIYERSGNTFTKLADPATLPTFHGRGITFSPDGIRLAVAHLTSPFITIYERSGNTFTKLADPATLPTGDGLSVTFSQDATIMPVTHSSTPFVTIYDSPVGVNTNGGSDFSIKRYGDNGAIIGEPLKISRETGDTVFKDGNVGIGATTPTGKLEVSGDVGDSNSAGFLRFASSLSNASFKAGLSTGYAWMQSLAGTPLRINELGNDVLFSGPGRIGIGTASPENKVHVRVTEGVIKTVMIDQAGTGDASLSFRLTGAEEFILGIDNSDGDKFKISDSGALGTNDRLTIDSLGNFGILTSTPQDRLHVSAGSVRIENGQFYKAVRNTGSVAVNVLGFDSGTDNLFIRTGGASAGNRFGIINTNLDEMVTVLNDGKVGIGTTTPTGKLDILTGNTLNDMNIVFDETAGNEQKILFKEGAPAFFAITHDGTPSSPNNLLKIQAADGADGVLDVDAITIRQNGDIGIGTTTPSSKLDILDGALELMQSVGENNTNTATIKFGETGVRLFNIRYDGTGSSPNNAGLKFEASSGIDDVYSTVITMLQNGNVGIGTTSPSDKLEVVGHIRANGFRTAALTTGADPVYIRGTGFNNPANRLVRIGGTTHVNTMGRGLQLTIITASTHALVSNTLYDTHGDSVASDNLATALNDLQRTQVGILTSYDSWSSAITDNLRTAARRLGLFKLGASSTVMQRYPYAAIFYGSGTATGNTEPGRQAIEIMESSAIGAPQAIITTWFTEDGFGAPGLPNALISANAAIVEPSLIVNSLGNVGIGTTTPLSRLHVSDGTVDGIPFRITGANGFNYNFRSLSDGTTDGRRLDIQIGSNDGQISFSDSNNEWMRITSTGNVGIGTATPAQLLHVVNSTGDAIARISGVTGRLELEDIDTNGDTLIDFIHNAGAIWRIWRVVNNFRIQQGGTVHLSIQDGGNVGIGTTVAPKRLSILDNVLIKRNDNGPGTAGNLELRTSDTSPISGRILFGTDGTGWQFRIGEENAVASTITDHVTVVTGGNVGIGTTGPLAKLDVAGQIRADNVTGYGFRAPGDTDGGMRSPGDGIVTFVTNSVERVRIDANGNVGIGTGVPLGRLRVVGTAGPDRSVLIDNREIKFIGSGAAHFSIFGADTGRNRISISNSSTGTAPGIEDAELLVVTFQGNVGIGATAPASKLEVVGTITSTGLNVNNNLITNVATPVSATDAANKDYVDSTTANLANWELVTTNIAAENGDRLLVDTSSSSITVTMPASPVLGDEVRFADKAGTFASNNLTIARNGSPIQGLLEDLVVDVNNVDFALVFTNATDGWRLSDVSNIVTGADPATTTVFQFTATAGQTVFTGLDDNGFGLVYTPGFEVVFLNGVKLEFADYVRTDSNTITLVEAATVDDVLTVLAFGTFDIANVYTQAEADAAFVAQGELPSPAVADTYLRRNTANTAYEAESSLDVSNDLITSRDWRGKNAIINGNFDIWQRGTSFPITTGVTILTADRWSSTAQQGGTGAATVTRQDFPPGFTDVPGNPRFYLRHDQTIATSASTGYVVQKIESVRTFAGQTVTFSFWARDLSGPTTLAPFIIQNFGTGGSPSTSVFLEFSPFVVTTSFQRFEITINVPSISGKTVGTADNDHIQFGILQNSTTGFTTFTLDFAQAQVELGSVATEFERRPIGTELALCQRYFEKTYDLNTPPGTGANNGALNRRAYTTTAMIHDLVWRFNTRKRVVPTVIPFSNSTGAANIIRIGSNELAATSNFVGHTGTTFQITGNHAAAANDFVVCHGTADAEL